MPQSLKGAAIYGDTDRARHLLDEEARANPVNGEDNLGMTPLHWAAYTGHGDVLKVLLEHGADPDAKDRDELTPLHCAARKGFIDIAKLLIEHKANVNASDVADHTPLSLAIAYKKREMEDLLREHGAIE